MDWRTIKGFEGLYWINSKGDVRNVHGKILAQTTLGGGLKVVDLYGNGQRIRKPIKTLLIEAYPELFMEDMENEK